MPIRAHPYIIWAPYACAQVASGIPTYRADHCAALARLALDLQDALKKYKDAIGEPVQVRGGSAHIGPRSRKRGLRMLTSTTFHDWAVSERCVNAYTFGPSLERRRLSWVSTAVR